ncbi:MAG: DUF1289 domain-containing protein [Proteobacteria bacterium]|jgi:predicted Fe-S protein YdhL (DUF1289 family)|nr:DUF1289 domain-containing protein [Pseudomonadota bacterium]MDA1237715.1 DUF1289 domain-containing protein [Pseudomonadota bacterium]
MIDEIWKKDEIQSPCIKICVVHPVERICTGCLRSIEEITAWSQMTDTERNTILQELGSRAGRFKKRRGGRASRQVQIQ